MTDTLYQALSETRSADLYTLDADSVEVSEPTQPSVEAYYSANAGEFSTREFRTLSYLSFTASEVEKNVTVSEEDLNALYHERLEEFKRPEQRDLEQLLFSKEEDAKAAFDALKSGKAIDAVAKAHHAQGKKPIQMKRTERDRVMREAAEAVFTMATGEITPPIKSAFGWHLFRVAAIAPPRTLPLSEVRAALEKDARHMAAESKMVALGHRIEDALAGGSPLAEVAAEHQMKVISIGNVDKHGMGEDGKPLAAVPAYDKFLDVAFSTDDKTESSLKSSKGSIYYIVRVESITPQRVKPLEEVRSGVVAKLKQQERAQKLAERAKEISGAFTSASERAAIAQKYKLSMRSVSGIKRDDDTLYPPALLAELFERRSGQSTSMVRGEQGDYVLAVMKQSAPSAEKMSPELQRNFTQNLEAGIRNELVSQYMDYLERKHGVTVNQDVLQSLERE
jgi:peptidyl-prolyl cis-trans isomerase D